MALLQKDIDYFNKRKNGIPQFCSRFGIKIISKDEDASVLDLGCGDGNLSIAIALSGAKKVVGIDIDHQLIEFANENLITNYPELLNIVEFKDIDLRDYPNNGNFDYIVSRDSFEHIIDLEKVLCEMKNRLRLGGKIYVGFGPLYHSYNGGHVRMKNRFPWEHLIIPESITIKRLNKQRENKIRSIQELGLNKWSLNDYKRLFKNSGLSIIYFKVLGDPHPNKKIIEKIVNLMSKIPLLKEYFSQNIYCILQKENIV